MIQLLTVRLLAIRMLGEIGGDRVLKVLRKLRISETDEEVLAVIENTLNMVSSREGLQN